MAGGLGCAVTTRLRLATVGAGYFSQFHHDAWMRLEEVELVAVCDLDIARAKTTADKCGAAGVFSDVEHMLDSVRPDLLDIIAPPPAHLACVRAAAERGVTVVCQKPFCDTIDDAVEASRVAEQHGVLLVVHDNFRFQPWYREIKTLIDAGRIGDVYQLSFWLRPGDGQGPHAYLDRQPYFQRMERFMVHETAVHFIDTFRFLLGEVSSVYADLRRLNPVIAGEDAGVILFDFARGARGLFDGNRLADHCAQNRRLTMGEMLLEGSAASLRLDGDGGLWLRNHGENHTQRLDYAWPDIGFGGDCVHALQAHVVQHMLRATPIENTANQYLTNLRVEQAVYESAARRERIEL